MDQKKMFQILAVVVFSFFSVAAFANRNPAPDHSVGSPKEIEHTFKLGESLWFLSKLYYGNANNFQKIIESNQLQSAQDVKAGQVLRIQKPLHFAGQPNFEKRKAHLLAERAQRLPSSVLNEPKIEPKNVPKSVKAKPAPAKGKAVVQAPRQKHDGHVETAQVPKQKHDGHVETAQVPKQKHDGQVETAQAPRDKNGDAVSLPLTESQKSLQVPRSDDLEHPIRRAQQELNE